jgi:hypothetical protein
MSYTTLSSSKCQTFSSSLKRQSSSHTRIRSRHILKMSEKMSDISRQVNQLLNQSIRSIRSVNQLINWHQSFKPRHQLFRSHSDKHLFNHYTLNCHTIYSTLKSISFITRIVNHSTDQSISTYQLISTRFSNNRGHRTRSIKLGLLRKHLNRIYLNQFNHLHLNHRRSLNHLHSCSHSHLNLLQNQFNSINRTSRMIDSDN